MGGGEPMRMSEDEFISIGLLNGWVLLPTKKSVKMEGVRLRRQSNGKPETITYWQTSGKVGTVIKDHPKSGNSQQFSIPTYEQLISMLTSTTGPGSGLRTHTNTGYRERKNAPGRQKSSGFQRGTL